MPTSENKRDEARQKISEGGFGEAQLVETELMLRQYLHEDEKLIGLEKSIFDITKANFAVFGAIMLVSSSSYFANLQSPGWSLMLAGLAIGFVSLAASVMVTFYHKYLRVHAAKTSILQKGFWRRRQLTWLELKYAAEELTTKFEDTSNLSISEYISYSYIMKWINMIPFIVVIMMGFIFMILIPAKHPSETAPNPSAFRSEWSYCIGKC